jgi:hypothetical protein
MNYIETIHKAGIIGHEVWELLRVTRQTLYNWDKGIIARNLFMKEEVDRKMERIWNAIAVGALPLVDVDARHRTKHLKRIIK